MSDLKPVDISQGIRWLDEHAKPGWRTAVGIEKLDIASPDRCVCGQLLRSRLLEGSANYELPFFARVMDYYGLSFGDVMRLGFGWLDDFPAATRAWRAFFAAQRAGAVPS